jgi:magnesium-transporting ATPase (P-type)
MTLDVTRSPRWRVRETTPPRRRRCRRRRRARVPTQVVSLLIPSTDTFDELEVTGQSYDPTDGSVKGFEERNGCADVRLLQCASVCALCNDAQLARDEDSGEFVRVGEPTECALRVLAEKLGPPPFQKPDGYEQAGAWQRAALSWRHAFDRQATLEFDRGRKSMSTVCTRGDATSLFVKGAPDSVIARCTRVRREDGSVVPLDEALRSALVEKVTAMASRPLRCLALATKEVSDWEDVERGGPTAHEAFESDLILEGVAGIRDPPRPEAKRAIARCKSAGVRVFMITGDSKETAVAIGKELGISSVHKSNFAAFCQCSIIASRHRRATCSTIQ